MADFTVTPSHVSDDWNRGSVGGEYLTGMALTLGDVVYLDSSNHVQRAVDNIASLNSSSIGIVVGAPNLYGETSIASGDWCKVTLYGPVYGFSGFTSGQFGYVSGNAGKLSDTKPSGAYQYAVGHAVNSDVFFVAPGEVAPTSTNP